MRVQWKSDRRGFATFSAELKAGGDEMGEGVFEAYVAMFSTPDRPDWFGDSDIIEPGAFTATLQEKGLPPIVWGHVWDIPPIGHSMKAIEDEKGLRITGKLFIDDDGISGQYAKSVFKGMTSTPPVVKEFSFAFEAQEWSDEKTKDGRFVRHLKKLELFEVGPVLVGRHPDTELIGAKGADGPARQLVPVDEAASRAAMFKRSPDFARAAWQTALGQKAGARNSTEDKTRLNTIVDKADEIIELARTNGADR